jgi:transposase
VSSAWSSLSDRAKGFVDHYVIPGVVDIVVSVIIVADLQIVEFGRVASDGHPALKRFANLQERHSYGIVNHCKHPIHTSKLEGVNNKSKVVKHIAYGFHDLDYFALKVKQALPGQILNN